MPEAVAQSLFFIKSMKRWARCTGSKKALLYSDSFVEDLVSGKRSPFVFSEIENRFARWLGLSQRNGSASEQLLPCPQVLHLSYEFGERLRLGRFPRGRPQYLFAQLDYQSVEWVPTANTQQFDALFFTQFKLVSAPSLYDYRKKFDQIQKHLLKGDCYQANLTFPFVWELECRTGQGQLVMESLLQEFMGATESLSAYAHVSYFPGKGFALLSNSPECLVTLDRKKRKLSSMPIKGSMKLGKVGKDEVWRELIADQKNQAELYMIADLLRNDLACIDPSYPVARIEKKKAALQVPGILHQFSLITRELNKELTFLDLLKGVFPGGSITGAPKTRVMDILRRVEDEQRGFYTGSTFFNLPDYLYSSINIRTAELRLLNGPSSSGQKLQLRYCAGGGITLQSKWKEEYEEMLLKVKSFCRLFKNFKLRPSEGDYVLHSES